MRAAQIPGVRAFHVLRTGERELIILVQGDDVDALEEMRAQVGDAWMSMSFHTSTDQGNDRGGGRREL